MRWDHLGNIQIRAKGVGNAELSNQVIGSLFKGIPLEVEGGDGSD